MHQTAPFNKISKRNMPQIAIANVWLRHGITSLFPKDLNPPPPKYCRNATVRMNILY